MGKDLEGPGSDVARGSVRVLFRYREGSIDVVDVSHIGMVSPQAEVFDPLTTIGTWHELKDEEGTVLYRRRMHPSMENLVEVPVDEEGTLGYRNGEGDDRLHMILVPDLPQGRLLTIMTNAITGAESPSLRRKVEPTVNTLGTVVLHAQEE